MPNSTRFNYLIILNPYETIYSIILQHTKPPIFHGFQAIWRTQRPRAAQGPVVGAHCRWTALEPCVSLGRPWGCLGGGFCTSFKRENIMDISRKCHGNVMEMSCINWGKSSKNGGFVIEWVIERDFMVLSLLLGAVGRTFVVGRTGHYKVVHQFVNATRLCKQLQFH